MESAAQFLRIPSFILFFLFLCPPARASVVINEFVYDPPGADTGNEWIELYNRGASTVSLEGWTVQTDDNSFPGNSKAVLCGSIGPHGFYLIKETEAAISTAVAADLISGTIAMGNAGSKADGLQLLDQDGDIRDRVVYGSPDQDGLCEGICSTAPRASNGAALSRLTPGASHFISLPASAVTPAGGGITCRYRACPPGSGIVRGFLAEVAPSIPSGDFIEIFLTQGANLCGAKILEGDGAIKTFPSVTPGSGLFGPRVLLHAGQKVSNSNPDETDASGDRNLNGAIDLYSDESSPGISGSVNDNLTLQSADGALVDFMSWTVSSDDSYDVAKQGAYDRAVSTGLWLPSCFGRDSACYEAGSIPWFNRATESMVRNPGARPFRPEQWSLRTPTPGKGEDTPVRSKGRMLQVSQSPFSPLGGGRFTEAVISYSVPQGRTVTIEIFDILGRWVDTVLDHDHSSGDSEQTLAWQGKDSHGRVVPAGVYVVRIEARGTDGSLDKDVQTVVVGRELE